MAKQIGAATYIECSALQSENSVRDIFHVATLACVNKTNKNVKRNKSQRATKRISHMPGRPELSTVATDLRKDKAKSCTVMWRTWVSLSRRKRAFGRGGGSMKCAATWYLMSAYASAIKETLHLLCETVLRNWACRPSREKKWLWMRRHQEMVCGRKCQKWEHLNVLGKEKGGWIGKKNPTKKRDVIDSACFFYWCSIPGCYCFDFIKMTLQCLFFFLKKTLLIRPHYGTIPMTL